MPDSKSLKRNAVLAAFSGIFAFACANATIVNPGASVTVTQSWAYTAYDGGDFVFDHRVRARMRERLVHKIHGSRLQVGGGRRSDRPGGRHLRPGLRRQLGYLDWIAERPVLPLADDRPLFLRKPRCESFSASARCSLGRFS